jgi:hypothetical protein
MKGVRERISRAKAELKAEPGARPIAGLRIPGPEASSAKTASHSAVGFFRTLPYVRPASSRERSLGRASIVKSLIILARPERFELPTPRFVV